MRRSLLAIAAVLLTRPQEGLIEARAVVFDWARAHDPINWKASKAVHHPIMRGDRLPPRGEVKLVNSSGRAAAGLRLRPPGSDNERPKGYVGH